MQSELSKTEDLLYEKWSKIDKDYGFFIDLSEKENFNEYWEAMGDLDSFEVFQRHGENKLFWADPYLIAMGIVDNFTVVTNETMHRNKERSIPYVCQNLNVSCMTFDEFLSLHNLPQGLYQVLVRRVLKKDGYFVTYFHPWEFYELKAHPEFKIPFIIKRNSGMDMVKRLDKLVKMLKKNGHEFITYKEFVEKIGK